MQERGSFRGNWELFLSECLLNRYNYLVMLHCLILFPVCVYIFPGQDFRSMVAAACVTLNRKGQGEFTSFLSTPFSDRAEELVEKSLTSCL